jgi:acylphosphatase
MVHYSIRVTGKVQGVFFRAKTKEAAERLGIYGWARNEPDGSVHIEAEAPEEKMKEFIEWCQQGPRFAHVQSVQYESGPVEGYDNFIIQR